MNKSNLILNPEDAIGYTIIGHKGHKPNEKWYIGRILPHTIEDLPVKRFIYDSPETGKNLSVNWNLRLYYFDPPKYIQDMKRKLRDI